MNQRDEGFRVGAAAICTVFVVNDGQVFALVITFFYTLLKHGKKHLIGGEVEFGNQYDNLCDTTSLCEIQKENMMTCVK